MRFSRLMRTSTLQGHAFRRWRRSRLLLAGGGVLGGHLAPEAVRSGAAVCVVDPEMGDISNLATQPVEPGVPKAQSIERACDAISPGRARGVRADIRHVGVGFIREFDLILDCTDDPQLAWPLTMASNGLGIPLLRLALDGTGATESGRVLASHGGAGHACQLCSYSLSDLGGHLLRSACPGREAPGRPPTLAGGATGMVVAGLGLLQAQRLLAGSGAALVLDREVLVDLGDFATHPIALSRSPGCLSGHVRWDVVSTHLSAAEASLRDLFDIAGRKLGASSDPVLEPFLHPLCLAAQCACGAQREAVGTVWAAAPTCPACGRAMQWRDDLKWPRFSRAQAAEAGILDVALSRLGLPEDGAMLSALASGREPIRLLLDARERPQEETFSCSTTNAT